MRHPAFAPCNLQTRERKARFNALLRAARVVRAVDNFFPRAREERMR